MSSSSFEALAASLEGPGAVLAPKFLNDDEIEAIQGEITDPARIAWEDQHKVFTNARGLEITQNYDSFLTGFISVGELDDTLPNVAAAARRITRFINAFSVIFPTLLAWQPNQLTLNRYDDQEVGLSFHKDQTKYTGVIAIAAVDGECDIAIRNPDDTVESYPTQPGDLVLLRAPGLYSSEYDIRPEHAVVNLRTPRRTSLMLRQDTKSQA
jgi:hypothetical protein